MTNELKELVARWEKEVCRGVWSDGELAAINKCITDLRAALAAQAEQPTALHGSDVVTDAFAAGWEVAALWANRDDLISDIGSPAYVKARDAALAAGKGESNDGK